MKFGIYVPNYGDYSDVDRLVQLARQTEEFGWDGFFIWDTLVMDKSAAPPLVDAWIALAAIAVSTSRLVIGPLITPVARRRPWKLARECLSLDHLSKGRAILGVGLGAPADVEFEALGEDPDDKVRANKLDEGLDVISRTLER
jgi:alkanesulfonate monooxygenase SsuD/methylene tetrahydromethanopterin reductase-like flavin-dependent oxidoreductase (luciferase family)